jgi:glutaryl-CoA dehydrogenase
LQPFERPIASYQLVRKQLAHMLLEIIKTQLMNYHLGRVMDEGRARHPQISMAKM